MAIDRRERIMQAAEELFANRRFHEVTLDEVARQAQVGKGTIYRHFNDKDDLFFQTATAGFEHMVTAVERTLPEGGSFDARLLHACREIIRFFDRRRPLIRLMLSEESWVIGERSGLQERWFECRQTLVAALAEILRQGATEGEVREDLPAELLASYLLGALRTRANDLARMPARWRELAPLIDLYLAGARPCSAPAASERREG